MAYDPILRWTKSPSSNVNSYAVAWTLNGAAAGTLSVPQTAAMDAAGYSTDFAAGNPTVTLQGGDVLGVTVSAFDSVDNLSSSPVSPTPLTIPASAPLPAVNPTLTLT